MGPVMQWFVAAQVTLAKLLRYTGRVSWSTLKM